MNKKLIFTAVAVLGVLVSYNVCFAEDKATMDEIRKKHQMEKMQGHEAMKHREFHHKKFKPNKAEMQAKKAEMDKRLNLTEEQKKKIEENRIQDHKKAKPIFDDMRKKRMELHKIKHDTSLSDKEKEKKIEKLNSQIKDLRVKADKQRQENMKNFESILTDEQKLEFAKIKEEQKQMMEQRMKDFEQRKKEHFKGKHPIPHPMPIEKEVVEK